MIVPMKKVTFIGMDTQKEQFLRRLQEVGVTHLIHPPEPLEEQELAKKLARVTETRKFLAPRNPGKKADKPLTARAICEARENLSQREARLQTEIASLKKEISLQEAW
jgi:V/A-type H+-transporting ATPase subunit I